MADIMEMSIIEIIHLTYKKDYKKESWYKELSDQEKKLVDKINAGFNDGIDSGIKEHINKNK